MIKHDQFHTANAETLKLEKGGKQDVISLSSHLKIPKGIFPWRFAAQVKSILLGGTTQFDIDSRFWIHY